MSNFLIFKAAFNNSATPAIGTYTAEGATAQFTRNTSISQDYYLYNTALYSAVQWFVPTAETTDFEFVADILTRSWDNRLTYFIIADSAGTTRLRMWSVNDNWYFENSDSTATTGSSEFIGSISPTASGGFNVFHQFRVRVRKLTASSSSVEVYVDGTLKLTATAGAALITCAKIGFVGGVNSFGPGTGAGVKNAYVYDLSGGEVIDRGVLSGAFNRFISWMKSKFALKSDIPTVNDATLTIQKNGTNVATFTANASTNKTANISVPTKTSDLTNDSGFITGVTWNDVSNKPSFATVATSGSYNDLSNKPTIPTVNDGTLTIQQNGTTVDSFSANSSSDKTVNITVPTKTSDLTNDSGFLTSEIDSMGEGWVRFKCGLQICYESVTNNNNVTAGVARHSFPMAFIATPSTVTAPKVLAESKLYAATLVVENGTTFIINSWASYTNPPVLTNLPVECDYVAIGKWK